MISKTEARQTILSLTTLPTLPSILHAVVHCVESPHSTAKDLKDIIVSDQSIAAKVLNVANSAYYGLTHQVSDLRKAVVVLGFDAIRDICLYVSFGRFFTTTRMAADFDLNDFWKHSIAVSMGCRIIGSRIGYDNVERALILGLIHDLGKVVISHAFSAGFLKAYQRVSQTGQPLHLAEQDILGFDHCEAGGWLVEQWDFPNIIVAAVEYHHALDRYPPAYQTEVILTNLADTLARDCKLGKSGNPAPPVPDPIVFKALELTPEDYEAMKEQLLECRSSVEHFFKSTT